MTHRYYIPQLPAGGGLVALTEAESRHAAQVMRVQPGDAVELFDGQNRTAAATVESVGRREVRCNAQASRSNDRDPVRRIVAVVAIPKGDRSRVLVEKLTELGVAELVPLVCHRSQWEPSEAALEKLRRAVIEACKQCGRNRLMQITAPRQAIAAWPQDEATASVARWLAHPLADAQGVPQAASEAVSTVIYAVGPEGGFTPQETEAAIAARWHPVALGPRIYRIETAALALAVWAAAGQ